jgi:hypothetical protein
MGASVRHQKLAENERRYARWFAEAFPGEPSLAGVPSLVSEFTREHPNLQGLLGRLISLGLAWRTDTMAPITVSHQPMEPNEITSALERFFQWTGEEAFAQLHPVEQTALCQARLLEISPFARRNVPLLAALSCFWLLKAGFVFPLWEHHQPGKYEEYLDSAFRLEMQPLVDYLSRGENQALRIILAG